MTKEQDEEVKSYSLKNTRLRRWIYKNHRTLSYVARLMRISKSEMKRKLREHEPFNINQIRALVFLVKARNAIDIIYFPTIKEKKEVIKKVFGERVKEKYYERSEKSYQT